MTAAAPIASAHDVPDCCSFWSIEPSAERDSAALGQVIECAVEQTFVASCRLQPTEDALHREKVRQRLTRALLRTTRPENDVDNAVLSDSDCESHAHYIENLLYDRFFHTNPGFYAARCSTLEYNLQRNGYYLLTRFGPDTVCSLPATKLAEETPIGRWQERELSTLLKDVRRRRVSAETQTQGIFRCPKCKGFNTTYYSMQTRGADEPMTNFVTCLPCNKRFRR